MEVGILLIFVLIAIVLLVANLSKVVGFFVTGVPFVRSSVLDIELVFKKLNWSSGLTFYELGSGDGRVVFLAEELGATKSVGFEVATWPFVLSQVWRWFKRSKVLFVKKNFLQESWNEADVIYCYLIPKLMLKVETKFLAECRPGTKLLSNAFIFPNLPACETFESGKTTIIVYRR